MRQWNATKWLTLPVLTGILLLGAGHERPVQRRLAAAPQTRVVPHALGLFVTPRGLQYINDNFNSVLQKNGFSMTEGLFPYIKYEAAEPFTIDSLRKLLADRPDREKVDQIIHSIETVRAASKRWLRGFQLNDPKVRGKILKIAYQLKFDSFGLHPDVAATQALSGKTGIVLVARAEVPELKVSVQRIQINDWNNPFLGNMGISDLWAGFANQSQPLTISMPIRILIDRNGVISAEALPLTTNIDRMQMDLGFSRPISLPEVRVTINGREGRLRTEEIENVLYDQRKGMLNALQAWLKDFAAEKVHTLINERVKAVYDPNRGEMDLMSPPGAPASLADDQKFHWGMRISDLAFKPDRSVYFELGAFVEDPTVASVALPEMERGQSAPVINEFRPEEYDVGIAINENLLNRALQLSFNRGFLKKVPLGSGGELIMVNPPRIVVDGKKGPDAAVLKLDAHYKIDDFIARNFAVRNPLHMKFDLVLRLVKTEKGLKIRQESIDSDSLWIDPQSLRRFGLNRQVYKSVRDIFKKTNEGFAAKESLLAEEVPLPEALYGVPLNLKSFSSQDGYLKLFLTLGGK